MIFAQQTQRRQAAESHHEFGGLPYERLPQAAKQRMERELKTLRFPNPRNLMQWEHFTRRAAWIVKENLSQNVHSLINRFTQNSRQAAVLIDGLPIGDIPPTPPDGCRPASKDAVSEGTLTGVINRFGEITSYTEEKNGAPIHEVSPVVGKEKVQSNSGRDRFFMHTDNRFLPDEYAQDGIALIGLRNESNVATRVITLEDLLGVIPQNLLDMLLQPLFRMKSPASFALNPTYLSPPMPIIYKDRFGTERIGLPSSGVEGVNSEAQSAFDQFRDLVESLTPRKVVLRPGRLLLFRNYLLVHGRDAVTADRWVQRAYYKSTIAHLRTATNSDPREYAFSARTLLNI